jgi:tRNA U34 2-thiouridine synthase MnmA/TrmU
MVRYRGQLNDVVITPHEAGSGRATIRFTGAAEGLPIASPGQAIVFYAGEEVLGGGTIRAVERATESGDSHG